MMLARFLVAPGSAALYLRLSAGAVIILLGVLNLGLSRSKSVEKWARLLAGVSGVVTAAVLIWSELLILSQNTNPDDFIPGQITLIMLVAIAVVPLRPVHALWLGVTLGVVYLASTLAAQRWLVAGTGPDENYLLFIVMLTMLCTAITAIVYRQRRAAFELQQAQARMMLAENAESMARLAAALSHELNTPMGALLSAVDTLLLLAAKQATCPPSEQQRLVLLQADIRKSVQQSANRLKELVSRLQRFTNLDMAEVQNANVNDLLSDIVALVQPEIPPNANVELEFQTVPLITCRPQQISAVFSSLLQNALQALDGGGQVRILTRARDSEVLVEIRDSGRGLDPVALQTIFEPGFRVSGTRVRAGNWNMFSSRQIVREHGGDIRIRSHPGIGTSVLVRLPVESALMPASVPGSGTSDSESRAP
jgi:signal transduction histidine kinase